MASEMCQRCRCCGFRNGECDGGDEHCSRVARLARYSDDQLFNAIIYGHRLLDMPDARAGKLLKDAYLSRETRMRQAG